MDPGFIPAVSVSRGGRPRVARGLKDPERMPDIESDQIVPIARIRLNPDSSTFAACTFENQGCKQAYRSPEGA